MLAFDDRISAHIKTLLEQLGFEYLALARSRAAEKFRLIADPRLTCMVTRVARDPIPHYILLENMADAKYTPLVETADDRELQHEVWKWRKRNLMGRIGSA